MLYTVLNRSAGFLSMSRGFPGNGLIFTFSGVVVVVVVEGLNATLNTRLDYVV